MGVSQGNNELIAKALSSGRKVVSAALGRAGLVISVSDDIQSVKIKSRVGGVICSTTFDYGDKVSLIDTGKEIKIINSGEACAYKDQK